MVSDKNLRKMVMVYSIAMIPLIGAVLATNDFYWNTVAGWMFCEGYVQMGLLPFNPYPNLYWLGGTTNGVLGLCVWLAAPATTTMVFGAIMGILSFRSLKTIPFFGGMYVAGVMAVWDLIFWLLINMFWPPILTSGPIAWIPMGVSQVVGTQGVGSTAVIQGIVFSEAVGLVFIYGRLVLFVMFAMAVFHYETEVARKPDRYLARLR